MEKTGSWVKMPTAEWNAALCKARADGMREVATMIAASGIAAQAQVYSIAELILEAAEKVEKGENP